MTNSVLRAPETFSFAESQFFREQQRYRRVARGEPSQDDAAFLEKSAIVLETLAIAGCLLERANDSTESDSPATITWLTAQTGIDVGRTLAGLKRVRRPSATAESYQPPDLDEFVRVAAAVLELCPVTQLQRRAHELSLPRLGHRIRVAYDALNAFLVRHDETYEKRSKIVGDLYMHGAISVPAAAALLGMSVEDAVLILESGGYARPVEEVTLSSQDRESRLARIREDRLTRGGILEYDPELVARNVVASERLEDVDARQWIGPAPHES